MGSQSRYQAALVAAAWTLASCSASAPASPPEWDAGFVTCEDQSTCAPLGLVCLGGTCDAPRDCNAPPDCPAGSSCRPDGTCEATTSLGGSGRACADRYECDVGEACIRDKCAAWPLGTSCSTDADCGRGRLCSSTLGCIEGCRRRLDCADDRACDERMLACAPCGADVACEAGEICKDGRCSAGCGSAGCASGSRCEAASGLCVDARCGDGVVSGGEACDDGNLVEADGCGPTCAFEATTGCATPGSLVLAWGAASPPAIVNGGSAWSIRTADKVAGPPGADGKRFLSSNGGRAYSADRDDAVRVPVDLSRFSGCRLTVAFPVWYELEPGRDGANIQAADTSSATPSWQVVGSHPGSMAYDRGALSSSSCAACFIKGQPVWSSVSSVSEERMVTGSLTELAGQAQAALRFTLHTDGLSHYRGIWVGDITISAR